jgi:Universal stress protein family
VTVAVGYLAGKGGRSALHLAVEAATTLQTSLTVVTVVPRPWMTPSPARIDAEYAQYAEQLAANSAKEAHQCVGSLSDGLKVSYHKVAHRSVSGGLLEAIEELTPEVLVLGSAADGKLARWWSDRRSTGRCTRPQSRWLSARVAIAVRKSLGCHASRQPIRARRRRFTSSNAWRLSPSGWMSRCGSSRSPSAAARCIRRRSGCTPTTRSWRYGRRTPEKHWRS